MSGRSGAVPQGSRLTRKGALTRSRIVAAAAALMFEQGVAGTTMEDVRAAAGVSSSQVYHYFADKSALVRAVIAYQDERVVGGQQPMLARLDSVAGLRAWRDVLVQVQRRHQCQGGCPIGSLASEVAETDPEARVVAATAFEHWEAGILGGFAAMSERGELVPGTDPGRLATATLAALQGALLLTQVQRSTDPLEATLDMVIDHVTSLLAAA